jgi:hypothetical protein
MNEPAAALAGSWTHSFEEDEGGVSVYRPTQSFAFPPARRGRGTLEFGNAGEVAVGVPGPDDRQQTTRSSMTPLGMNRFRVGGTAQAPGKVIEVVDAQAEALKLRIS